MTFSRLAQCNITDRLADLIRLPKCPKRYTRQPTGRIVCIKRNVSSPHQEFARAEEQQYHPRADRSRTVCSKFEGDPGRTVEAVEICPPEAQNARVRGSGFLKKTKTGNRRDEVPVISRVPYFNPIKHSI